MTILDDWKRKLNDELLEIENREDLTDDQKVNRVRHVTCAVCAGFAVQPIPFADIFVLTPIQALGGTKIATIRGVKIAEQGVGEIIKEIAGVVGLGLLAQQFVIGAYKMAIPFLGAITTIPIVYGLTYAVCSVMDYYFKEMANGRPIDKARIKAIWRAAKKEGEKEGKARKDEIRDQA